MAKTMKYNSIELGIIAREGSEAFCKRCGDDYVVRYDPSSKLCYDCLIDIIAMAKKVKVNE